MTPEEQAEAQALLEENARLRVEVEQAHSRLADSQGKLAAMRRAEPLEKSRTWRFPALTMAEYMRVLKRAGFPGTAEEEAARFEAFVREGERLRDFGMLLEEAP